MLDMLAERTQINVRVDSEILGAIEEIRKLSSPIPTIADVVRRAILELRDKEHKSRRK